MDASQAEPANGLDPRGMRWIRGLVRSLAEEGRTILVSSHLMSEMAQSADQLVDIAHGPLLARLVYVVVSLAVGSALVTVRDV